MTHTLTDGERDILAELTGEANAYDFPSCPYCGGNPFTIDPDACCDAMLDELMRTAAELEMEIMRELEDEAASAVDWPDEPDMDLAPW